MPPAPRRRRPLLLKLIMALAAVGLFLVGYQWGNQSRYGREVLPPLAGVLIRPARPLPDLALTGPTGTVTATELEGRWSLLALASATAVPGHRAAARMIEVANRLADRPALRADLRLLLISGDDVPRLARGFQRLTPDLWVLTADRDTLAELRHSLGAPTSAAGGAEAAPPLYLIDPRVSLTALFPGGLAPAAIASDLKVLAASSQWADDARPR
jgi:hypothetical protein